MFNKRVGILLLSSLACLTVAQAQTSLTSGALRGVVKAKKAGGLAAATVSIRNVETGLARTAVTNAQGEYSFVLLPVGQYEVSVSAKGMRTLKDNSVRIGLGAASQSNFALDTAEAAATVEVVAAAKGLDTTQVNSVVAIDSNLVEGMPLNGRNFTDLVRLTPGAVTGDQGRQLMEGARGIMNNLTIDGASYNSTFYGEQRGSTTIPFAFGLDTIKELQVIQDAYDPQYGNAAGGIINAISKTGTNEITGSAMMQFRPASLVALMKTVPQPTSALTNTVASRTRDFSQSQYNFTLGGPIIKDKLHFFVGMETQKFSQSTTTAFSSNGTTGTNSDANLATFMTKFGNIPVGADGHTIAQENGLGYTNQKTNTAVFARVDWTINESHRATFRVNTQKFKNENASYPGGVYGLSENYTDNISSISWVAELTSIINTNIANEARIQIGSERRPRTANTNVPELTISGVVTTGQYWAAPSNLNELSKQFIDNLTYMNGDWTIKGGVDMQWFDYQNQFPQYSDGYFQFSNLAAANAWATGTLTAGTTATYKGSISPTNGWINYSASLWGGYMQAQYAGLLDHRLMITGGLRVTRENQADNPLPNPQFAGTDAANSSTSVDPRLGFTYDLTGQGKTIVRGGFGYFSSPNTSLTVSNTMTANGNTITVYQIQNTAANLAAWNTGALSYANITKNGTALTALNATTLASLGGVSRVGQLWDPNNKLPLAKRASLGIEHKLDNGIVLGAKAAYADFTHLQQFVNVNLGQKDSAGNVIAGAAYNDGYPTTNNSFTTLTANRPGYAVIGGRRVDFTGYSDVFLSKNNGYGHYKALILTAARQSADGFGFQSSLSFASQRDTNSNERVTNNGGSGGSVNNNPANPGGNLAPGDYDVRFRGVFAGYFPIYWGVRGMAMVTYQTGLPYSTVSSTDVNGDGAYTDYAPGYGGRNNQRQPGQKTASLRFTRDWKIAGKLELEANIDIFNPMNWANYSTNQYTAGSTYYGYLNTLDTSSREMQFGIRLKF